MKNISFFVVPMWEASNVYIENAKKLDEDLAKRNLILNLLAERVLA